jgi:polyisoprenoid-binding protein YceI
MPTPHLPALPSTGRLRRALLPLALAGGLLATLALLPRAAAAQSPTPQAELLLVDSEIRFTTRQMGVPVDGRFSRFDAEVALDPRQPAAGRVVLRIETGSARFGSRELDAEVPKPIWLSAAAFPEARFESSAIRAVGDGRFEVAGSLTIKGRSQALTVPVTLEQAAGGAATATGQFTLRRLDFAIGEGDWSDTSLLANDVLVRFRLRLNGLPPA